MVQFLHVDLFDAVRSPNKDEIGGNSVTDCESSGLVEKAVLECLGDVPSIRDLDFDTS